MNLFFKIGIKKNLTSSNSLTLKIKINKIFSQQLDYQFARLCRFFEHLLLQLLLLESKIIHHLLAQEMDQNHHIQKL